MSNPLVIDLIAHHLVPLTEHWGSWKKGLATADNETLRLVQVYLDDVIDSIWERKVARIDDQDLDPVVATEIAYKMRDEVSRMLVKSSRRVK